MYTDAHIAVEDSLEVSTETMQHPSVRDVERQFRRADVVTICQRQACNRSRQYAFKHPQDVIPCSVRAASRLGCSNSQHSWIRGPHAPLMPDPLSLKMLTACSMTTYGVSDPFESLLARLSLYNFDEESGAMYAVYDAGIEIPSAADSQSLLQELNIGDTLRFKNLIAPSKHSGLSSLSPNEPRSSLTRMSTFSGTSKDRISP